MEFSEKAHTSQTNVLSMVLDVKMLALLPTNVWYTMIDILSAATTLDFGAGYMSAVILWHIKTTLNTAVAMG